MSTSSTKRSLDDWVFSQVGGGQGTKEGEWITTSSFPTTVHVELLKLGRIPDPFLGLNEWDVQWVGEAEWIFKSFVIVAEDELSASSVDLVFEGLDTFARVTLNGRQILSSENQFVSYRVPVKDILQPGSNELILHFESAFLKGRDVEKANGGKLLLWNGDSSRLHVRKAQYNYGWDWGPILMTTGPWKPIYLHTYSARIEGVDIRVDVAETLEVNLSAKVFASDGFDGDVGLTLLKPNGDICKKDTVSCQGSSNATYVQAFSAGELDLWYPVGYGAQPLYTVVAELLDEKKYRTAFRRARIVEEPLADAEGLSFLFEINNIRIFCGGSNWIPADSFLTRLKESDYRKWLELLVAGNQNMIRVWGGGIYEYDCFYDICDVLVWQDFMFGCGQSVKEEAIQNVKRLRHHPSIVIWGETHGDASDYQVAESYNLELDYSDETSDFRKTNFPARYIYERVLPEVVAQHTNTYYHRGSPYSGHGKVTTDKTLGDIHQWNVWHGSQEPWHNLGHSLLGRFVSEFGMQGYPNIRTVDHWLEGDQTQRYPQVCNNHNKADGFERRLELYLMENFKHSFEMERDVGVGYRLWRRNWKGRGREYTSGALINDCWPVTSWAIVDYFKRPKPAYFTVARELRPFTVGMTRKEVKTFANDRSAADFKIETVLEVWGTNNTLADKEVKLEVTAFDLDSDWTEVKTEEPLSCSRVLCPGQPVRTQLSDIPKTIVISARLLDGYGTVLGRYSNWPEPFKFIDFPPVDSLGLKVTNLEDGETVPIKGIVLDVDGADVQWGDQAIDLVPGDPQKVRAVGLKGRRVKARFLGDGTA
ncbi:beta-mannosidase [Coprinopsis sp. MPI-PUGE-AT-0042]|nr:beta-mannosidase [Coprinopsis sp. MPI-PUGE-AT-0042]